MNASSSTYSTHYNDDKGPCVALLPSLCCLVAFWGAAYPSSALPPLPHIYISMYIMGVFHVSTNQMGLSDAAKSMIGSFSSLESALLVALQLLDHSKLPTEDGTAMIRAVRRLTEEGMGRLPPHITSKALRLLLKYAVHHKKTPQLLLFPSSDVIAQRRLAVGVLGRIGLCRARRTSHLSGTCQVVHAKSSLSLLPPSQVISSCCSCCCCWLDRIFLRRGPYFA